MRKKSPPMTANELLALIKYKPKYITDLSKLDDGVQIIEFRKCGDYTASIEFGNNGHFKKDGGFYFYFEIVDWSGTVDGEFVPLDSERRKDVLWGFFKTKKQYEEAAAHINKALRKMYRRKRQ